MALIQCPECGQMISDKARKCPNCGYVVPRISKTETSLATESAKANSAAANKKRPKRKLTAILISIGVIVIAGGIAWGIYSYNEAQKQEQARLYAERQRLAKIESERQEQEKRRQQEEEERRRQEEHRRREEERRQQEKDEQWHKEMAMMAQLHEIQTQIQAVIDKIARLYRLKQQAAREGTLMVNPEVVFALSEACSEEVRLINKQIQIAKQLGYPKLVKEYEGRLKKALDVKDMMLLSR